jgi:hypothetical protein
LASEELSNAISSTIVDNIGDIVDEDIINNLTASSNFSTAVTNTISVNAAEIWDMFDGIDNDINTINAGGATI